MADINFIEVDAGEIYNMIITALETKVSEPLYPGDERRLFGEAVAAVMVAVFNKLNDDARQSLRAPSSTRSGSESTRRAWSRTRPAPSSAFPCRRRSVKMW